MAGVRDFAGSVAGYVGRKGQLDPKDIETLSFGLEVYIITVISYAVILIIACWLAIIPYVLSALATNSLLRFVSGGAHSATFSRCLILSVIFMVGIGQLVDSVGVIPEPLLFALTAIIVFGGFCIVHKWAPADTPSKPIVSVRKRAIYRRLSYIFLSIWGLVMNILILSSAELQVKLALASIAGCCWQIFSITPLGYKFMAAFDSI